MSPNSFMNLIASSPGSAEPDSGTARSDEASYLRRVSSGSSMIRCTITGTIGADSRLVLRDGRERLLGIELAPQDHGRRQQHPEREVRESPRVEQRGDDERLLTGLAAGSARAARRPGPTLSGCLRVAPFGVPVVPEVRMTARPSCSGGIGDSASADSISSSSVRSLRSPSCASGSCQATKRLRRSPGLREQLGELLVVDDRDRLLALDHLGELRPGELGVQVEAGDAELRAATVDSMK